MTAHQRMIRGVIAAQILPSKGDGVDETERRKIRNRLKATRKKHRRSA